MHYILNGDGTEQLFDLSIDSAEREDVSASADYGAVLQRLRGDLR